MTPTPHPLPPATRRVLTGSARDANVAVDVLRAVGLHATTRAVGPHTVEVLVTEAPETGHCGVQERGEGNPAADVPDPLDGPVTRRELAALFAHERDHWRGQFVSACNAGRPDDRARADACESVLVGLLAALRP